jgi:hypothetical protein
VSEAPRRRLGAAWAWAGAAVLTVAILTGGALYVFRSLRDLPGDAVEEGRRVLADLGSLAAAFTQGTVETRFHSYATSVTGTTYLQFATVRQTEVFRRTDEAATLWGFLELPDVVVEASVPVETTYYLDLDGTWRFVREGREVRVHAPAPRFNEPAVEVSALAFEVRRSSLLRDSDTAVRKLQAGITTMARMRARDNLELVREVGRRRTEDFVRAWLLEAFGDGGDYRVVVTFADEDLGPGAPRPAELPARDGGE